VSQGHAAPFWPTPLGTASIGEYIEGFYNCARRHSHDRLPQPDRI
jgi:hypothetical protein